MSYWVATTIVAKIGENEEDDLSPKERATIISYWLRVLEVLSIPFPRLLLLLASISDMSVFLQWTCN